VKGKTLNVKWKSGILIVWKKDQLFTGGLNLALKTPCGKTTAPHVVAGLM